ncbi:sucrose phosphorylase [Stutzerimonas tarimensis]|uniref:Sucrose phosphorylase n=1 Tax=Stutzerimonas tarimensis TaxID=1507735 RepID=A0ABV7T8N6_9GAMM
MPLNGKVQLIAYPNRIGADLADLAGFIERRLGGAIGGVHVLPPYPSNSDGGFSPLTHKEIDPIYGSWDDLERLADRYDLCLDLVLNHLADDSPEFQDFIAKGNASAYAGLFVDVDSLGEITQEDLERIHIRKEKEPFRQVHFADGSHGRVWCTFTERQVDLNYGRQEAFDYMADTIAFLGQRGIRLLRLDAFGYTTKKIGSTCFLVEPEVWQILRWFRQTAAEHGIELLPEVHDHPSYQVAIAREGMWGYGFALPPLLLYTLLDHNSRYLKSWLRACPRNLVTVLDTHDGICIPDVEGILPPEQLKALIDNVSERSADPILRRSAANPHSVGAIYQLACTFYDALARNDEAYLVARAIQLFAPGIPQVYYVGLLVGCNDDELAERTGEVRDINRRFYSVEEADAALDAPLAQRQLQLIRLRSTHPAFTGEFELHSSSDSSLSIGWRQGEHFCHLFVDLGFRTLTVTCSDEAGRQTSFRI